MLSLLRQYSHRWDLRHLKTLAWMVTALVYSSKLSLPEWEVHVPSRARQAQSTERRWQRFMGNRWVRIKSLYVPLVLAAIHRWKGRRLYLALDTTVLWNRYCMIHLSVTCCGRAVPLLWRVLEHSSASVSANRYLPMLRLAHRLLEDYPDVMVLADRGFANRDLLEWLSQSRWHYCLRLPSDVVVHGPRRHPVEVGTLWPPKGEARCNEGVGLWTDGRWRCNLVLANVRGVKEPWAVITDGSPSLNTLWQYALRFRVEELFLDSKSGVFDLEASGIRSAQALERLYLVAAVAILYGTTQGMAVQLDGLRSQVDPHWTRGIRYLNIGLRWLRGVVNKGCLLRHPIALFTVDPEPCFASKKAEDRYYNRIWFSRIQSMRCQLPTGEAA
ncbi:transposase [Thermoleptolyngbya sp. C42_A2020_037]|uniref:transposase n=1 Tax=Thermoleptolyngbya sp. C42_A2020_037 TaxID=2747799 RepID=UPI0025FBF2CF|nr:transposase [Thermoleptolyngbya sp. C42_A2020_037]